MKYSKLLLILSLLLSLMGCADKYKERDGKMYYTMHYQSGGFATTEHLIEKADISSFVALKGGNNDHIGELYAKDKNRVYYQEKSIENADPLTFKPLGDSYAIDKDSVFYKDKAIAKNLQTFKTLGHYYAKDNSNVYSQGYVLNKIADPKSYELLKGDWAKDKFYYYKDNFRIEDADYANFKILCDDYAKDKNHVYYAGSIDVRIIEGADVETFRIKRWYSSRAKDKYRCYDLGEPVKCE